MNHMPKIEFMITLTLIKFSFLDINPQYFFLTTFIQPKIVHYLHRSIMATGSYLKQIQI